MERQYVDLEDGVYGLRGSRVALGSIVAEFWRGSSPEAIAQSFPVVTLEQVYGAIAFYLANRSEVDAVLTREDAELAAARRQSRDADPLFYRRLDRATRESAASV